MEIIKKICDKCQTEYSFKYQFKIDAIQDTELASEALAGNITTHTCPNCGHVSNLDVPVCYQNVQKKFIVYYLPESYIDILDDSFFKNPDITNLPGQVNGRYTSSAHLFMNTINDFETTGTDHFLSQIINENIIPPSGIILL